MAEIAVWTAFLIALLIALVGNVGRYTYIRITNWMSIQKWKR